MRELTIRHRRGDPAYGNRFCLCPGSPDRRKSCAEYAELCATVCAAIVCGATRRNSAGCSYAGRERWAPAADPAPPAVSYNAAGNGSYSSALAENIEAVEGLQRHSPLPLHEFHVYEGRLTKLTPALGLSVRRPDQGHGTYALVVDENGKHYQFPGHVNSPLIFTDSTTHREYALVVLRIADRQVYGYVRPMQ